MSELMSIQSTVLRFTQLLSKILSLDIEVVDSSMVRVAGTGRYASRLGLPMPVGSNIYRSIISSRQPKIISAAKEDALCQDCTKRSHCDETAMIGVPILVQDRCLGVISLVCFDQRQRSHMLDNVRLFSDYIDHVTQLFIAKIIESQAHRKSLAFDHLLQMLVSDLAQGMLVLDESGCCVLANKAAIKRLDVGDGSLIGCVVELKPLSGGYLEPAELRFMLRFAGVERLVSGRLHSLDDRQVFILRAEDEGAGGGPSVTADHLFSRDVPDIVGQSPGVMRLKRMVRKIASSPSSILIYGESGTGKEVFAQAIHRAGSRAEQAFVAINCAAIPDQLLESELFGYVKGAFTGASAKGREGMFRAAHGGTLFLDEIGDMPLHLQAKLLRVLDRREVTPVGSNESIPIDVHVVSATNKNFQELIDRKEFREDLYYRLNVIPLHLPPLRDRHGDVDLLINFYLERHSREVGVPRPRLTSAVLRQLESYSWPGNVRELSNLVEYLVNMAEPGEPIDSDILPPQFVVAEKAVARQSGFNLEDLERSAIADALSRFGSAAEGKGKAAEALGIGIATLYRKIKKYDLESVAIDS